MKGVYIFLADGFEEIEALAPVDILRRGGIGVTTVAINECEEDDGDIYCRVVTGSHGIPVAADISLIQFLEEQSELSDGEVTPEDVMIFPGGMPGAKNLASCTALMDMLVQHGRLGGTIAAICASPAIVLAGKLPDEVIAGRKMTCYDSMEGPIERRGAEYVKEGVVVDGNLITSRGPAFAEEFGLTILAALAGKDVADAVAKGMLRSL